MAPFEADLEPRTNAPRLRFNFANGWSASVLLNMTADPTLGLCASTAACPTGQWGKGKTEIGAQEATPDEVAAYLSLIAGRPAL